MAADYTEDDIKSLGVLLILRADAASTGTAPIGMGTAKEAGGVVELEAALGVKRSLDLPAGAQLPRSC